MKLLKLTLTICLLHNLNLHAAQVMVFAAASLTDSFKQIAVDYEKSSGDKIVFNFGASGTLARQIEEGAPADIFVSADEGKMDALAVKGLLAVDSRRDLLGNTLVIVTAPNGPVVAAPTDLTNSTIKRIALGDTRTVPAGTYAKSYLHQINVWPAVEAKIVPCENVRAVLAAVQSGNVDAGVVYKTDATISKKVNVAFEVPSAHGPKITYPIALLKDSPQPEAARKFFKHLESETSAKVFREFGFIVLDASAR